MVRAHGLQLVGLAVMMAVASVAKVRAQDPNPSQRIDSLLRAAITPTHPGCAAVVLRNGETAWAGGFGVADLAYGVSIDTATVFQAGSLAKQVTAFAILLLAEEERLALDDDVRRFVPELPRYGSVITIRHLLQHTGGLRDEWDLLQFAGWRAGDVVTPADAWSLTVRQRELNFSPGTEHLYSNTGYDALARVVAAAAGMSFPDFVRDRVFRPLGMARSRIDGDHMAVIERAAVGYLPRYEGGWAAIHARPGVIGPTNFFTTAGDLARWMQNLLDGTVGGPRLRDVMRQRAILASGDSVSYAMGLVPGRYRGARTIGHGGAERGYLSEILLLPEHRFASAVLCNRWNVNTASLVRRMTDVYLDASLAPRVAAAPTPAVRPIPMDQRALRAVAGTYREVGGLRIRPIVLRDSGLVWTAANWQVVPVAPDRFRILDEPVELVFRPRSERRGLRMQLLVNGQLSGEFEQMPTFERPAAGLSAFAGVFTSEELGVDYHIMSADSVLQIRGPHGLEMTATPTYRDAFVLNPTGAILEFRRAADGTLSGFTVSTERVRRLEFGVRRPNPSR